ncbi:MAG: aminopeptidase N, partial [Candidatus Dormibacteria bacterium]
MSTDNLTRAEAAQRAALLSHTSYDIALTLHDSPGRDTFESITTIEFDCARPGASTFLDLDAPSVDRIEINGEPVSVDAFEDHRIALNGLIGGRNTVRVVAACAYQHTGVGLHRVVDPVDERIYLFTHFEPFDAHKVFACFDQPDLKGPFSMHVTAPQAWKVISNGAVEREEAQPGSQRLTHFAPTPPISTYLAAVVAGPFHAVFADHGNIPLGLFCRESLASHLDPEEIFEITRQGLDFFAEYFQIAYPFGKYDQLMVPEFNMGAMENPGCVTFNEAYVFRSKVTDASRSRRSNTILHEMAHMWFGDLVTMRWWDDLWLNESFATYMATLAVYEATRFRDSYVDFANATKSWAARQDQLPSTHPIAADMVDTESVRLNFDGITYAKGASVLRQLVAWVGDDPFREGLRQYFRDFQWSNATLAEFLAALERSSGRELGSWSREWLETAGIATLRPESTAENGRYTELAVIQSASPEHPTLRSHRLALGFYSFNGGDELRRTRRLEIDVHGPRTEVVEAVGEAVPDLLLINDGDLAFAKVRLDPRSTATLVASMRKIDDPLSRALC